MPLTDRITCAPRAFEADRASEARDALGDLGPDLDALVAGVAGCSPYLKGLLEKEAEWLREIAATEPESALQDVLGALSQAEPGDLHTALRRAKRRVALLVALCDCGGIWSLEEVTGALTRLADLAVARAWGHEVGAEIARGRLRETAPGTGGLVVLAMGKMGAFELNYSSDIDLVCLFDETLHEEEDGGGAMEARTRLVRATRKASALLNETSAEGYVFRTDLRLRPDPSVTPVCLGMEAAERYYESLGRTWERAALIKARPCAGDVEGGARYLDRLRPFIWRRHLDFAAIEDAHAIRRRIRDHKGLGGAITLQGHDLKLGRGGIREIEFFTQTRQIIAGGRDESLRVRGTVEGLGRLAAAGWVDRGAARQLAEDYRALRNVEHRLQMIADRQTHALPDDAEGVARLAAFLGRDEAEMCAELEELLLRVSELTEDFFAPSTPRRGSEPDSRAGTGRADPGLARPPGAQIRARARPLRPDPAGAAREAPDEPQAGSGAGAFRRVPARPAGGGAVVLALRGEPGASRPDRRHRRDDAGARGLSQPQFRSPRFGARGAVLRRVAGTG